MTTIGDTRVTRVSTEVMSGSPRNHARVSRVSTEVMSGSPRNHARVSRVSVEVMANAPRRIRTTRVSTEVMSGSPRNYARVSRMSIEVMSSPFPSIQALPIDPLQDFFVHNWVASISTETISPTSLSAGEETLSEARMGLSSKPFRTLRCRWTGIGARLSQKLWGRLMYIGDHTVELPLYSDHTEAGAGCTTRLVYGDFSSRRFHNGGKVGVRYADGTVKVAIMVTAAPALLTLSANDQLDVAPAEGDVVFPVLDVWPNLKNSMSLHTDNISDLLLSFDELPGPSSLPFSSQNAPSSFDFHESLPILDLDNDWSVSPRTGFKRAGFKTSVGKAEHSFLLGPSPQVTTTASRQLYSKEDAWKWINLFDSLKGRLMPLWVILPSDLWEIVSVTGFVSVEVIASGKVEHTHNYLRYLAVYDASGFVEILAVSQVTDLSGSVWSIELSDNITTPSAVTNVRWCFKARNSIDSYTDTWTTDEVATFRTQFTEVLNERESELADLDEGSVHYAAFHKARVSLNTPTVTP